jgi:NADPH-dependent 2,4-dienoyl-CoA reductase/sulfur reductase-like enzyme
MTRVAVVGAGPAGIRAAEALHAAGVAPVLIDEGRQAGGQGYRAPAPGIALDMHALMGSQAGRYEALHAAFADLRGRIDHRPGTLVWAIEDGVLHVATQGRADTLAFDALILATGAMDRVAPVRGWTLPGVFTLGGAQVALKEQGCLVGRRVAFCGSSPLLALAALQYHAMGAQVVGVCDTTSLGEKVRAAPRLAASPGTLARGLSYLARLKRAGVPLLFGVAPETIEGGSRVEALVVRDAAGRRIRLACDAVALGHGLKPETQLAELAGATFDFDPARRLWLPRIDADGRAGPGLYLAGDGAAIGGADAAEASGELAALAALADLGRPVDVRRMAALRRRVRRLRTFQMGLARAFAWPARSVADMGDDVTVCRCENIDAGEIREAARGGLVPGEVNRVKAITRCGMGRCQGRVCGSALQEIVAAEAGVTVEAAGRLRGQAPVKPVMLSIAETDAP